MGSERAAGGADAGAPFRFKTAEDTHRYISESGVRQVKLGVADVDGILRGKYVSRDKFLGILEKGFGFCDVIVGWDSNDQLYDNVTYTGWHTGYPDATARVLPATGRLLPFENDMPFFLCELTDAAEAICPRGVLRRVLDKAATMGFAVSSAFEYEFFLFEETPESVRAKNYKDLKPMTPGFFGYSVLRSSVHAELYGDLLAMCHAMDMPIEGLHTETGPGVLEAAIAVDDALSAADKAILFKTFTKVFAQRRGLMATFMAKWSNDWPGQSGHIHISLRDAAGKSVFHDAGAPDKMSDAMRHFIGGQQLTDAGMARDGVVDGEFLFAARSRLLGADQRHLGHREPDDGVARHSRQCRRRSASSIGSRRRTPTRTSRFRPRSPAACGASRTRSSRCPPSPATRMTRRCRPNSAFPARCGRPRSASRRHPRHARAFGDAFVDHFAATREWEEREFRKHITDWELARYFEII